MGYAEKRVSTAKGSKGKVTWRARYKKPDGAYDSQAGFATKKLAEAWADEQEAAIRAGRWIDPDLSRTKFGDWAREWMRSKSPRGRTVDTRWRRLEEVILPKWDHTPLLSFTWFDVESWANSLDVDDTTVNHCVSLMSSILTGAVDARRLHVNPLYGRRRTVASGRVVAKAAPRKEEEKWVPPVAVLLLAERLGPAKGLHVLTTAFTGMRWGESCGLHRDNVLLTRSEPWDGSWWECPVIRVDQELSEVEERDDDGRKLGTVLRIEPPKNEPSVRDIDVPPFLAELLRRHLAEWPHEFVFCSPGGAWWRRSNWLKSLRPAADGRPALPRRQGARAREAWAPIAPGATMRALRHSHDTYQAQIGVAPVLQFEQAGHRYPGIKGTYQHPTPEMRQARLDGLQEIYERALRAVGLPALWGRGGSGSAQIESASPDSLPNDLHSGELLEITAGQGG